MSSAAVTSPVIPRSTINPWFVAVAVVIPTFMEVLDTTIANVALRYIAGGLSAAVIDSEWVLTSYLAANATILPISGWISAHLGRRNYFLLSIAVFTIASALCGMATSLGQIALVMSCWEIMLSKGQEFDWLGDPFGRVQTLLILFVLGLGALIFRELRIGNPVVNFRALGERNLAACCVIVFCAYGVLYG